MLTPYINKLLYETILNFHISAFKKVLQTDLVDECIVLDNDEDDHLTEEERWGRFQERVKEGNDLRVDFMDW